MPKLLHLIYRKADSAAVLDIVREPVKKRFFFKDGVPVAASSNILNEVLGRLLMQEGIISQREYEKSLDLVLKEKRRHGEVLISMGLLSPEKLESFLTLQLKRRLLKIFSWNEGTYHYTKSESAPAHLTEFPLHPASLILEGISLGFYPEARMRSDLKDNLDRAFKANETGRYGPDDFRLNLQEKRFLSSFDGAKTLRQALEASDLLRHRALSLALSFIITGLIDGNGEEDQFLEEEIREAKVIEAAGDSRLNAELLFMKAKSLIKEKDFSGAIGELKKITELNPVEAEYWAYLGWAVFKSGPSNIKEAERILKDAIDLNNELDSAWYFLGRVFLSSGDTEWAKKAFKTALSKNPWMTEAASELMRIEVKEALPLPSDFDERIGYAESLGLSEDPFTDEPLDKYLSLSNSQSEGLELLLRGVRKKSGPMLLAGGPGTGKTVMALELLKRLSDDKVLSALILRPGDKEIKLMKAINSETGAVSESPSTKEQLLSFGMRVSQNKIQGGNTLIIIDKAEALSPGCLKLVQYLSRLKTLQIILIGESRLLETLKSPEFSELDQKALLRFSLSPFTLEETAAYIQKRLTNVRKAADSSLPSFTEGEIRSVFEGSGGVPAYINERCAALLKAYAGSGKEAVKPEEVQLFDEIGVYEAPPEKVPEPFTFEEAPGAEAQEASFEDRPPSGEIPSGWISPLPQKSGRDEALKEKDAKDEPKPQAQSDKKEKREVISFTPLHQEASKKKASGLGRLIMWIIFMLAAGLAAGSIIGLYWFEQAPKEPQEIITPEEKTWTVPGVIETASPEGSLDQSGPKDGSFERQMP